MTVALDAVKEAEKIILHYHKVGAQVEFKADQSPVTIADKEAEAKIRQVIAAKFPDHTFFGEEGEQVSLKNHRGYTWIIDPIDGTKGFMRGVPLFATLLALMHDGELILGVSNMPLMNELIYAEKGQGAWLNDQRLQVSNVATIGESYISSGSIKHFVTKQKIDNLIKLSQDARQLRTFGDTWSYHLTAQGKIDAVVEDYVKFWDVAAATVIIREAGGRVTKLDGSDIDETTDTVLASNDLLHDEILNYFN